jgi:hypothetical protein
MSVLLSCLFWLTRIGERKSSLVNSSLVDSVRSKLFVEHTIVKIRKKSLKKSFFGGFAIPILPLLTFIGFNDAIDKREAMVHELVHVNTLIYGFQTAFFYLAIAILTMAFDSGNAIKIGLSIFCFVLLLLFQEFIAFFRTRLITHGMGFNIRDFTWIVPMKYVFIYGVYMCLVLFFVGILFLKKVFLYSVPY